MLEVTFSESACGSLKVAQHYGEGKYRGGAFGFIATHKDGSGLSEPELERLRREADARARRAWEQAVPLGGRAADVFCFDLALSVGNIRGRTGKTAHPAAGKPLCRRPARPGAALYPAPDAPGERSLYH